MLDFDVKKVYHCNPRIPNQKHLVTANADKYGAVPAFNTPTEVGIEIEAEKVAHAAGALLNWTVTKDGSLKDNGLEFVSHPLRDENLIYAISEMDQVYKANPGATFSHRCSIHVHMNVSKLTVGQLRALIATYMVVEGLFFSLVVPEREGNSYCYPMADMCLTWDDLDVDKISDHFKYCALNPHHLRDFGTLEFRHHGGTKDKKELLNWVETILQLYRFVEKHNPNDIETSIRNLNTISFYADFVQDVFEKKYSQFLHIPFYKFLRNNVTAAKVFLG